MQRKHLFYFFFLAVSITFIARLFYIQVLKEEYKLSALNNALRVEKVYPGRGLIYDRNQKLLVGNQSAYDLMVIPAQVKEMDTLGFCRLLHLELDDFRKRLRKAKIYSWRKASIFVKQVSREDFAYIQEQLHNFPGFYPQKRILRDYMTIAGANVLGFIGETNERFIQANPTYELGDLIGKTGIEKSYEDILKGKIGVNYRLKDVHNRVMGPYEGGAFDTLPQPGLDIQSTIDIDLQHYGEMLMKGKRGSVVAIEPSTGEILALVSSPSYNPNLMVGRQRSLNYNRLYRDSINLPLFDRGLLAEYPPGSPFKVINALIGLQEGTLTPETRFTCHHGFHYGRLHVACHCGTGSPIALRKGISKSCNNYFCRVFKGIIEKYPSAQEGMDVWSNHVKSFNIGRYLNNDLPTGRKGLAPTADYYDNAFGYTGWKAVSTISLGIGQGELLLTPIQMANMTAAIANRGYYYTPHIVKAIGGKDIEDPNFTEPKYTTIDSIHFPIVIEGMFDVFENGTARGSRLESITMCGKTGTAENPHGQDHSIFVAFAPKDDPKIAISIIVENGYWGSRWAAPIASLMIERYINGEISREALEQRMLDGDLSDQYAQQLAEKYGESLADSIANATE
ncbi:MAG: penicillin-binding protein 2 [Bacteroidetes bacterium]|nr:penicillin-binding protein 2 [Bacteroidota bacterium]